MEANQKVSLGCGTLILIALIVMFFSGGVRSYRGENERDFDQLKQDMESLKSSVQSMRSSLEAQNSNIQADIKKLEKTISDARLQTPPKDGNSQ